MLKIVIGVLLLAALVAVLFIIGVLRLFLGDGGTGTKGDE